MVVAAYDDDGRRKNLVRAGITALNLIVPGLGLLRIGNWRAAVLFLLAPVILFALFIFGLGHFPITNFGSALLGLIVTLGAWAALFVSAMVLTWRDSRFRTSPNVWSRWYSLTAIAIVVLYLTSLAPPFGHRFYKPFYAPSESMAPTIEKDDKFVTDMRWRGPLRRGEIVVFNGPDSARVSRVAALSGDRIALRDGVPIINGKAVVQSPDGQTTFASYNGVHSAANLTEQFPGESLSHRVLDAGPTEIDNMPEVVVPPGHFFVLGDNRDNAADSRVPPNLGGVGMVPLNAIIGRPMYIHWSSDRSKIGTRLDR